MEYAAVQKLFRQASVALAVLTTVFAFARLQPACAGARAVFVGDDFYTLSPSLVSAAKTSGYNTLILSSLNIKANGDITYTNGESALRLPYLPEFLVHFRCPFRRTHRHGPVITTIGFLITLFDEGGISPAIANIVEETVATRTDEVFSLGPTK